MLPSEKIAISVVVICFNQERTIAAALDSVLNQTAADHIHEVLVIDDASTDGTVSVACAIAARDAKVQVLVRPTNSGGCAAPRNDGMSRATGSHVALLDGDDIWQPEKIERQLDALRAHPEIGLLFSDVTSFDAQTGHETRTVVQHYSATDRDQLRRFFVEGGPVLPSCAILSRAAIEAAGLFDPGMPFNEDAEYWLRIAAIAPIHHQRLPLVRKRAWFGSLGSAKYGLDNLACKREITRRMIERAPELKAVEPARTARIEYKTALHFFATEDTPTARRYLRRALSLDPTLRKAQIALVLSYLSPNPEGLLRKARRVWARLPMAVR